MAALLLCFDAFNRSVEVWNGAIPVAVPRPRRPPAPAFSAGQSALGLDDEGSRPDGAVPVAAGGQFFACTDGLLEAPFDGHVTGEEALDALLASVPPAGCLGRAGPDGGGLPETPPHDDVSAMLVDVRKLTRGPRAGLGPGRPVGGKQTQAALGFLARRDARNRGVTGRRAGLDVFVAEAGQEALEGLAVGRRDLHAHQHAAEVGAVVAVVEQADVPVGAQGFRKLSRAPGRSGNSKR